MKKTRSKTRPFRNAKRKCPNCGKRKLTEELEDCALCGGGYIWVCENDDCNSMFDHNMDEV
jgi:hypothetical protein